MSGTENYGDQLSQMNTIYNSLAENGQTNTAQAVGAAMGNFIAGTMSTQNSVDHNGQ